MQQHTYRVVREQAVAWLQPTTEALLAPVMYPPIVTSHEQHTCSSTHTENVVREQTVSEQSRTPRVQLQEGGTWVTCRAMPHDMTAAAGEVVLVDCGAINGTILYQQ
jgi:hypothetical protein